ncbi:MAG: HAD family hydrolase [Anaerolineae bacterium]
MPIKAFMFDCGGVILGNPDLSRYHAWEDRLGLQRDELATRLYEGIAWRRAEVGELTEDAYWIEAGRELGIDDPQAIDALKNDMWDSWTINPRTLALIDRVRQRHRVAILSNATDVLRTALAERYGIADRFDCIISSAEVGVAKPERGIYEIALERLALAPEQVVFIDDRPDNVAAAANLGMHVIWFVNDDLLARQMQRYLQTPAVPSDTELEKDGNGHNVNGD